MLHTMLLPMEYKRTSRVLVLYSVVSLLLFYVADGERYYVIISYLKVDCLARTQN